MSTYGGLNQKWIRDRGCWSLKGEMLFGGKDERMGYGGREMPTFCKKVGRWELMS